jgi:hypothetical protein
VAARTMVRLVLVVADDDGFVIIVRGRMLQKGFQFHFFHIHYMNIKAMIWSFSFQLLGKGLCGSCFDASFLLSGGGIVVLVIVVVVDADDMVVWLVHQV